jgi:hypothetical protein
MMADLMGRAAAQTVGVVVEIGFEEHIEMRTGLDDSHVAWWLAGDERLADVDRIVRQDPGWTCAICAEGLEAQEENGWVVRICTNPKDKGDVLSNSPGSPSPATPSTAASPTRELHEEEVEEAQAESPTTDVASRAMQEPQATIEGHIFHEGCLRRWLIKKNSCPVCRNSPVMPQT